MESQSSLVQFTKKMDAKFASVCRITILVTSRNAKQQLKELQVEAL